MTLGLAGDLGTDCSSTPSKPKEKQNIRCRKGVGRPALREYCLQFPAFTCLKGVFVAKTSG